MYMDVVRVSDEFHPRTTKRFQFRDPKAFRGEIHVIIRQGLEELPGLVMPRTHVVRGVSDNHGTRAKPLEHPQCGGTYDERLIQPKHIPRGFLRGFEKSTAYIEAIRETDSI